MLISYDWLSSFLPQGLPAPEVVADALTALGLEVDGIEPVGAHNRAVKVAEVRGIRPHPKADRLRLVQVFDGAHLHEIVCGAPNVPDPGGKVAFAPEGVELPGGLRIEARTIRGVPSAGMLCSEAELDLGPDADGILVLDPDAEPGRSLADLLPGAADVLIELSVTPNRPDALGHLGVARDLAAKFDLRLSPPPVRTLDDLSEDGGLVSIEAPARCGRYLGVVLEGARVGTSPLWARVRLHRMGLRPISAAVDVTNLVLVEWGQPLHVFDRDVLAEGRVVVRTARANERIVLLDGAEAALSPDDLVIADARRPAALAGIMGGADSAVHEGTASILLEAAYFDPPGIRATARRLGISTDSSMRFERGVDPMAGLDGAAGRALDLLCRWTGARPVARCEARGRLPDRPSIRFRTSRCRRLLGVPVTTDEAARGLARLEVAVERQDDDTLRCVPPTHRPDLRREVDLFEEVLRLRGLDTIEAKNVVPSRPLAAAPPDPARRARRAAQDALAARGLHEVVGWAFQPEAAFAFLDAEIPSDRRVGIDNPLRDEPTVMRPHLLPGLLRMAARNIAHGRRRVRLFEVGRVYAWPEGGAPRFVPGPHRLPEDDRLPEERTRAGFVLAVQGPGDIGVLREAGDICVHLLARLGFDTKTAAPGAEPPEWAHPGLWATVRFGGGEVAACFGEIHPDVRRDHDLDGWTVAYGEVDLSSLPTPATRTARPLPKTPGTARDLSLVVPRGIHGAEIRDALVEAAVRLEGDVALGEGDGGEPPVEVIEEYHPEDDSIAAGARSVLFRLHYRAADRTIRDDEADACHEKIVGALLASFEDDPRGPLRRR